MQHTVFRLVPHPLFLSCSACLGHRSTRRRGSGTAHLGTHRRPNRGSRSDLRKLRSAAISRSWRRTYSRGAIPHPEDSTSQPNTSPLSSAAPGSEPIGDDGYFQTANWQLAEPNASSFSFELSKGEEASRLTRNQVSLSGLSAIDLEKTPSVKVDFRDPGALKPEQVHGKSGPH